MHSFLAVTGVVAILVAGYLVRRRARRARGFFPEDRGDLFEPEPSALQPLPDHPGVSPYRIPPGGLSESDARTLLASRLGLSLEQLRAEYRAFDEHAWGWSTGLRTPTFGPGPILVTRTGRVHIFGSVPHDYFAEFDRQWAARLALGASGPRRTR